jgi:hypothetical protein
LMRVVVASIDLDSSRPISTNIPLHEPVKRAIPHSSSTQAHST